VFAIGPLHFLHIEFILLADGLISPEEPLDLVAQCRIRRRAALRLRLGRLLPHVRRAIGRRIRREFAALCAIRDFLQYLRLKLGRVGRTRQHDKFVRRFVANG
jgi:hypothetical protein